MRSRPARLALLLSLVLAGGCARDESAPPLDAAHTDVVLITLCTVRADHLGAYGYELPTSPTLDALAQEGVLLERVLTNAPWTRPSIAATITGIYPRGLEIDEFESRNDDRVLDGSFETLAERLSRAGYATIGVTANPNVNAVFGFGQGYDVYRDTGRLWAEGYGRDKLSGGEVAERLFEAVADVPAERRLFAHVVLVDAHPPFEAAAADAEGIPTFGRDDLAAYDRQIRYADGVVGRIQWGLRGLGRRNLLLVVTADHGEGFGQIRPEDQGHGRWLYDSTLWVPLVLHHPALAPRRIPGIFESVDLAPTLLDLLGVPVAAGSLEGRSFAGAVRGGAEPAPRESWVSESGFEDTDKSALLTDEWKLVVDRRRHGGPRLALYRRPGDERESVAAEQQDTAQRLLLALRDWRRAHPGRLSGPVGRAVLAPEQVEELEALGYARGREHGATRDAAEPDPDEPAPAPGAP